MPQGKPKPGGLFYNNKTAFVDSTLNANKDKEWVQRLYKKNTPKVKLPGEDKPSTHLMADDGNGYVFPSLVLPPGQTKLSNMGQNAEKYARKTNTGIQFKKKEQGDYFASNNNGNGSYGGYKKGTGVLPEFKDGVKDMKTYKGKYKKAAKGLQSIAVPEQGSDSNVLSSATSMASAGSQFGPWGAVAGGALGLATGLFQKNAQDKANNEAVKRNKYLTSNRAVDGVEESIDQKMQVFKHGGKVGTKMIEIEGKKTPEIHTDKNFNIKNLGTTPHSKGGNKVEASEGDIVFNTQDSTAKYNKIVGAIKSGDKQTLIKEKNKLPEDTTSKMQQGVKGTKKPKAEPDYMMEEEAREAQTLPTNAVRNARSKVASKPKPTVQAPASKPNKFIEEEKKIWGGYGKVISNIVDYQAKGWTGKTTTPSKQVAKPSTTTPAKPTTSISNFVNTKGTKTPLTTLPKPATKPKGVAVAGRKINTNTPKIATLIAAPIIPGPKTGNFALEAQDGNNVPMARASVEPTKPIVNTPNISATGTAVNTSMPNATVTTTTKPTTGNIAGNSTSNTASNIMQFAGVANNLFQGMKSEKPISEKYFDPELNKYVDRSQSLRNASNSATTIQNANARNVSGGSAGNMRANQQQAALSNLSRQEAINEQEMTRRDAVEVSNTGLKNSAAQYNLQRKDMYQSQIDGTRAAKQAYIDQAASDVGQYGMSKREEQYMRDRDDKANAVQLAGLNRIKTKDFGTDEQGNQTTTLGQTPITTPVSAFPTPSTTPAFNPQTLYKGKLGKTISNVFKKKK